MRVVPYRVYRNSPTQRHDLSMVLNTSDIYGEDMMGRIFPDDEAIIMPAEGILGATAQLWAERGVDLSVGYLVAVKKPRVVGGVREATSTTLLSTAEVGATTLSVVGTTGFEVADQISIKSGSTIELCTIKAISVGQLTIYDSHALENEFAAGSTVLACRFYRVIARRTPHDTLGPYQVVTLKEIIGRAGMLE